MKFTLLSFLFAAFLSSCLVANPPARTITPGAEMINDYLFLLKGKGVGVLANQTSMVQKTHLVDTLKSLNVKIKAVFAPEHGFRGEASDGAHIKDGFDVKSGVKVISLYGDKKTPSKSDMEGIDIMIFDIQDVGARFYTFSSTLQYIMEVCAEKGIPLIVLDRPNPNGFYVDGPVLDIELKSFIGLNEIPIVHGLTLGEYAQMLNGEGWLKNKLKCDIRLIRVQNYSHKDKYKLPVLPSPNLQNMSAIYLYPSLCLFEGTQVSLGRGTDKPFQLIGFPDFKDGKMKFTPRSIPGVSDNPPYKNKECSGIDLSDFGNSVMPDKRQVYLYWLISMYKAYPEKDKFFIPYFEKLAGTKDLRKQIESGMSEEEIRKSWEPKLGEYKKMRKKYLLYTDFE